MKPVKLARTPESLAVLDEWHDRFSARLGFPTEVRRVETRFGWTDVVVTGPDGGTPLLLLHGAMSGAPHALGELAELPARRRIYAVNVPGQSTRAAAVRLKFGRGEYADWVNEVVAALGLSRAVLAGVSWGGAVSMEVARRAPAWLTGLILVVPGGLINGPAWPAIRDVVVPMMRYRLRPTEANLRRALAHLTTDQDPLWTPYLGVVFRHWKTDFSMPPMVKDGELADLRAPVFVFAADGDRSFPGAALLARAAEVFSNYLGGYLFRDTVHTPSFSEEARRAFAAEVERVWIAMAGGREAGPTAAA